MYVQVKVQQHATFHVEVITSRDTALRITVSTVYAEDKARYLGSSLRFVNIPSLQLKIDVKIRLK